MNLPAVPSYDPTRRARLEAIIQQTHDDPPADLAEIVRDELGVDLATQYAGVAVAHPFGKASGQLSCTVAQVEEDVHAGIAFIVLKTAIAETASGARSMDAWTVRDTKMRVEQRVSARGRAGWTVTWTGRGWHGTLAEYVEFFRASLRVNRDTNIPVIPSVKYHLPERNAPFRTAEYDHTTQQLVTAWDDEDGNGPLLLEKDFSPTLAGDARSEDRQAVLRWLEEVPGLIEAATPGRIRLGIKVMNAVSDDEFQLAMLDAVSNRATPRPAFLVVSNRLFDPDKGVAYGGWDLSDRNLRVLDLAQRRGMNLAALSATGNICSGRVMLEYALRGCENGQIHTFFQVPRAEYIATGGSRSSRALHTLMLHPEEGLVPWLWHLNEAGRLEEARGVVRFRDAIGSRHA